jgi:hypothetical protein
VGKQSLIAWMNYERGEMANGKSDGTEVPFRRRRRWPARRVWAIHLWIDVLSCTDGPGSGSRGARGPLLEKRVPAESAAGDSEALSCAVFDLEVTAYDVRLPKSRRYGEGQCVHER